MLRVGAVHEHSSYSDGDPTAVPRDYFDAARTGVNGTGQGVVLDFLLSSEHSDNNSLPLTTNEACLPPGNPLACSHVTDPDHLRKWASTLEQANEASSDVFTALRGFEWTNDVYNHMNVYLSTNVVNVKVDGSYLSMDVMWDWLREPVARGGGADALVTFNHPGREPSLTPFDSGGPHSALLTTLAGGANWNDLAYVPDVDDNVAGMEVNGGDDIEYYVLALTNGWHIGAVAAEDEHGRNWSSSDQGKTLMLTRGRSPQDHYFALQHHRTVAVQDALIGGAPGDAGDVPRDPVLGRRRVDPGPGRHRPRRRRGRRRQPHAARRPRRSARGRGHRPRVEHDRRPGRARAARCRRRRRTLAPRHTR